VGDLLSFFLAMMIEALVADPGGAEISFLDQVISDSSCCISIGVDFRRCFDGVYSGLIGHLLVDIE
jgi:hypothetical protein